MIENYLTVDVEDYYQVSAFADVIQANEWGYYESRIQGNLRRILEILDRHGTKATFFVVGWIAERFPEVVAEIAHDGHEIGCHSYMHRTLNTLSPGAFREDTKRAKDILENLSGKRILGYRAPSYSITRETMWALKILKRLGFEYDSSIFPIHHDRYGIPDAPRFKYTFADCGLVEYPISTVRFLGQHVPVSGGGYFRLLPYLLTKRALRRINEKEREPFVFYIHPWELDPGQPRIRGAGPRSRFRHYQNLQRTAGRLERLLQDFAFRPISSKQQLLNPEGASPKGQGGESLSLTL